MHTGNTYNPNSYEKIEPTEQSGCEALGGGSTFGDNHETNSTIDPSELPYPNGKYHKTTDVLSDDVRKIIEQSAE